MKVCNLFFATVVLLFTVSCQNASKNTNPANNELTQKPKYVQQIPDSLRIPEQKELVKKLLKMTIDHVKVVQNQMVFDMSREEFSQTNIPMKYFELFKRNMKENNEWIKKNNIKDVDKMVKENRRRMQKELNNM